MPQYITSGDIIARIGESDLTLLADQDCDAGAEQDPIGRAIADAEAEVDSYIGNRYKLPLPGIVSSVDPALNTVPAMLPLVCVDIAVYRMAKAPPLLTEAIRQRYEDARAWLTKVSNRVISLGVAEQSIPPTLNGGVVRVGPDRVMTRDKLKGLL